MKILKIFSVLLSYPTVALQKVVPELRQLIAADIYLSSENKKALTPLLDKLGSEDIYTLEEDYVFLFDRSRSLSLNLFEHVHGESRDRGSAMVDLLHTYEQAGFALHTAELPDYLPVLLEFLSTQTPHEAKNILNDAGPILVALAARLKERQTPYAAILKALVVLAQASSNDEQAQQLLAEKIDNPNDLEALDAVWEETAVTFGPESLDSCSGLLSGRSGGDLNRAEAMLRAQLASDEFPIHIQRMPSALTNKQRAKGGNNV